MKELEYKMSKLWQFSAFCYWEFFFADFWLLKFIQILAEMSDTSVPNPVPSMIQWVFFSSNTYWWWSFEKFIKMGVLWMMGVANTYNDPRCHDQFLRRSARDYFSESGKFHKHAI